MRWSENRWCGMSRNTGRFSPPGHRQRLHPCAPCEPLCAVFRGKPGKHTPKPLCPANRAVSQGVKPGLKRSRRKQWRSLNAAAITSARSAGSFRGNDGAFLNPIFAAEGVPNWKSPAVAGFFKAFLLWNPGNGSKIPSELYNYEKEK